MRLAATAAVLTLTPTLVAQEFPAWGDLRPGPFAVGFESRWELDTSRVYDRTLSTGEPYAGGGKAPRPILVNLWYPALPPEEDAIAMTHGEYLNLTADDASLRQLSMDLAEYANGVIAEWAIGKTLDALDEWSFSQLERLLATPTASYRYAARAEGRFPMVIYHAGYGSSFEDNSVLCEYLASHGYMVVGSAFLDETGESLNIDGKAGSARDFGFLIQLMSGEPRVDWQHVGVVGHSGGAHASLEFQSQPAAAVDAVISLDTTQDYVSALDPHWRHTAFMLKGVPHEKTPLLMVAQPHAFFQAADRLVNAERYYLTFRDLEHNDYTLQGVWTAEVAALRARRDSDPGLEEREAYARAARRGFEQCTEYARIFLDAFLKNDKAARGALGTLYRDTPLAGDDPHVEYAAKGVAAPPTFDLDGSEPPTPREAIALLAVHGAGVLAEVLERVHPGHENAPVFHNRFAFGVLYDLLATHRADEAALLAPLLCRLHPDLATNFAWWAERDPPQSYPEFREYAYAAALLLDPDNETLRQKAQPSAR